MITHKPDSKKSFKIGHITYTPDKDGYVELPFTYKMYNPTPRKIKKKNRDKE